MKATHVRHKHKAPKTAPRAPQPQKAKGLRVPAILLEGDAPTPAPVSGPGQRYALAPTPPVAAARAVTDLPDAYGTERLFLTARDPHWLYAHWDLTREQLRAYNARASEGHLTLRVFKDKVGPHPYSEVPVHPESRNWFVNVADAGATYVTELGYYRGRQWTRISTSGATFAPPETLSEDTSVWFETMPSQLHLGQLVQLVKQAVSDHVPLMEALQHLRARGYTGLPDPRSAGAGRWTAAQERALGEVIRMDVSRRIWMGSLEITEVIRRQVQQALFSPGGAWSGLLGAGEVPASPALWSAGLAASVSSPFGRQERRKGFWFNVNAELVIYGATEPDAAVTIGGRAIKLRPDGTFSYRFALPDGRYELPAVATSADGTDSRRAALAFSRQTEYRGGVEAHPQDPQLKTPAPEHLK